MTTSSTSPRRFFKELRFQQLRALVEVSRLKSFAAAAVELELATPSVWQQVRGLEAEFGVELVRIDGKNVELTEDGQVLVDAARPIVEGLIRCTTSSLIGRDRRQSDWSLLRRFSC